MSIDVSLRKFKGVDFKKPNNENEDWIKLLDFYNDCGLSPFLGERASDFSISWKDYLFYFYGELENEEIK